MINMFGKKEVKAKELSVMHYEGIPYFATDYPCTLLFGDEELIIRRQMPETTVVLPKNRILSVSAMEEPRFMLRYHGNAASTSNSPIVNKYYLAIVYDKGLLAFWGTAKEYGEFLKIQNSIEAPAKYITL